VGEFTKADYERALSLALAGRERLWTNDESDFTKPFLFDFLRQWERGPWTFLDWANWLRSKIEEADRG